MKIKLPAIELKYALMGLCKLISRKAALPVLEAVRIEAAGDTVQLTATDLESTVTYTCLSPEVDAPGLVILEAKRLKELVAQAKQDQVEITAHGTDTIQVNLYGPLGNREHALKTIDQAEWPADPPEVPVEPTDMPFATLYRTLVPFASTDITRAVLNGVCIDVVKGQHTLVATDGRRLSTVNSLQLPIKEGCVVPTNKFLSWPKLEGDCAIGTAHGYFRLECGLWSFTSKTVEGTYPNWRQVVPDIEGTSGLDLAEDDLPALKEAVRTLPEGDRDTKAICLVPHAKAARLAALDGETDTWCHRDLPASSIFGQAISINRAYLREAVGAGFRSFRWENAESPLVAKTDSAMHVVMPVRAPTPPSGTQRIQKPKTKKEKPMPRTKTNGSSPGPQADDQLWLSYQQVKEKARELNTAISDLGHQIKESRRQGKSLQSELNSARGLLNKLQSIKI